MRVIEAARVHALLDYAPLADRLGEAFRRDTEVPVRHHHGIRTAAGEGILLLMPAWQVGGRLGVKLVTFYPGNPAQGLPTIQGLYAVFDAATGQPLAVMDGTALTLRRTAAASALASRYLSRAASSRLLMVGAGALAPHLVRGHRAVRPLRAVSIWNRRPEKAAALAMSLRGEGIAADAVTDLEPAARAADIISCATPSRTPLIKGAWIKPGTHLDLVGGFTPEMREADDDVVRRARLYVDTRAGAAAEAGDIVEPVSRGVIPKDAVLGDLFDLCGGRVAGRESGTEITVFKSCGTAIEDLAAAELVLEQS